MKESQKRWPWTMTHTTSSVLFSQEKGKKKQNKTKTGELNKILCLKIDILINVATNKVLVPLAMESP